MRGNVPIRAIATLTALVLLAGLGASRPRTAAALPGLPDVLNPCNLPGAGTVCDLAATPVELLGDAAGQAAGAVGQSVLGAITGWVGDGAAWLVREVVKGIDASTRLDLGSEWFGEHFRWMVGLGGMLLLPFLLLAVLQGLIRQDWTLLVRAAFAYLPAAMLLTGLALAVTQTALAATDALAGDLARGVARDADRLGATFSAVVLGSGSALPLFVGFLIGLVMASGAFVVWVELLLRTGAIYLCVMLLPLFLAALVWPATGRWARRLVELLVALVMSKLVIVAALALGLGALTSGEGVASVLAGAAMFLVAAFAPFALLSLIPFAAETVAHPQRQARAALAGASGGALAWQAARTGLLGAARGAGASAPGAAAGSAGALGGGTGTAIGATGAGALWLSTPGASAGGGRAGATRAGGPAASPGPPPPARAPGRATEGGVPGPTAAPPSPPSPRGLGHAGSSTATAPTPASREPGVGGAVDPAEAIAPPAPAGEAAAHSPPVSPAAWPAEGPRGPAAPSPQPPAPGEEPPPRTRPGV